MRMLSKLCEARHFLTIPTSSPPLKAPSPALTRVIYKSPSLFSSPHIIRLFGWRFANGNAANTSGVLATAIAMRSRARRYIVHRNRRLYNSAYRERRIDLFHLQICAGQINVSRHPLYLHRVSEKLNFPEFCIPLEIPSLNAYHPRVDLLTILRSHS